MASDIGKIEEAMPNARSIDETYGCPQEDIRRSAPGLRRALASLEQELKLLLRGAERHNDPLAKMARGEALTAEEREYLRLR